MKKILVIGSLNMDLVTYVSHLPAAGETISSFKFLKNPGGKGANQAVAAAKLGANVAMIGKVGMDEYGSMLINSLKISGVSTKGIKQEGTTGMAFINVSVDGENQIVLVAGANKEMNQSDIDDMKILICESDIIIMQLEIPLDVVEYALTLCVELGKQIILNPAPAQRLSESTLHNLYALIPNQTELGLLTDMPVSTKQEIIAAGRYLKSLGVKKVIVTMGNKGSYIFNDDGESHIPAYQVKSIDSTAAGDTYIAGFAVGLSKGMSDREAALFASKAAAIVVTREGAQSALPTIDEVNQFQSLLISN